ncbi:hypothetical protein RO3G_03682 [Rhizopus delemar RA 99-880]|uniref:DH domain-containing protein n=1 Tax=Rhizopus delemar (strain RA 99-880 / ATCC MYA-4621 / FGSC 9543 / NRRL 43880) TaxID=246409 RepID=I1BRZ7_RHIO9|nr:hypothetical protein RO3G_03682 [Rhizopus delemar RA 99-880]|eukprot:EIE78977.1 hypothetical protein RO3G_03682 [Rhizopus delemar RA 99-880]
MKSAVQYIVHDEQHPSSNYCCCCCCCSSNCCFQFSSNQSLIKSKDSCCCSCLDEPLANECIQLSDNEKTNKKKIHAIDELLQTERDYVYDLNHLTKVCLQILNRQPWIIPEHKAMITRNIQDILSFHKLFITHLNSIQYDWCLIAKTFLDQMANFSLYKQYCDKHTEAWSLLSIYRNRSEWAQFTKECVSQDIGEERRLHFEDYLIKPVQRICRYQLLIKEIIRYTARETPEYDLWEAVLNEMQEIVTEIDDLKFQRDMKERTDRFIKRLDDDWRMNKSQVSQLGHLLIAGAIEVTYSALGQSVSKPRYLGCFVFSTYIIMVRPKKVTNYEPKHWFPLRLADFENLEDIEGQREHSFIVRCKKHTFVFSATCSQEKQLWVKKIQQAIEESKKTQKIISKPIVSSLPGLAPKRPQSIRTSRSFTNILDMTITNASSSNKPSKSPLTLRRSISTHIQLEQQETVKPALPPSSSSLVKRYSADYATRKKSTELKPRNNSETYAKRDSFSGLSRRRPSSSLDLLSDTSNMIGKMSTQFKNNHQNAMRLNVDHKLHDVCTQEYLASRAWHKAYYCSELGSQHSTSPVSPQAATETLKKRKSTSLLRNSVSNLSLIIPRRNTFMGEAGGKPQVEFDTISTADTWSHVTSSRKSSMQSQGRRDSLDCTFTVSPSSMTDSSKSVKASFKKKKRALAEKVLRRITSIRQMRPHTPEWNMSGDTLRCEMLDVVSH